MRHDDLFVIAAKDRIRRNLPFYLGKIPKGMRDEIRDRPEFAVNVLYEYARAGEKGRREIDAFYEFGGPSSLQEAHERLLKKIQLN